MAIVIKDLNVPNDCLQCRCFDDHSYDEPMCRINYKEIRHDDLYEPVFGGKSWLSKRPDWCPLIEVRPRTMTITKPSLFGDEIKKTVIYEPNPPKDRCKLQYDADGNIVKYEDMTNDS